MIEKLVLVYRKGRNFGPEWVRALVAGLSATGLPEALPVLCLTDDSEMSIEGVRTVPFEQEWPGWWAKLELFRPGLVQGPALFMDLDTLPVGDWTPLLSWSPEQSEGSTLIMLSDFYQPHIAASGVLGWTPSKMTEAIYWEAVAQFTQQAPPTSRMDYWLRRQGVVSPVRWQELHPDKLVSLKAHAKEEVPEGAALVCGHGRPRFSDEAAGWAHDLWKARAG